MLVGLPASSVRLHPLSLAQGENDVTLAGLVGSRREGRRQVCFAADRDAATVVKELSAS